MWNNSAIWYSDDKLFNITREIKSKFAMAKTAINKKTFHREILLKFKEETSEMLHLEHNLLWC